MPEDRKPSATKGSGKDRSSLAHQEEPEKTLFSSPSASTRTTSAASLSPAPQFDRNSTLADVGGEGSTSFASTDDEELNRSSDPHHGEADDFTSMLQEPIYEFDGDSNLSQETSEATLQQEIMLQSMRQFLQQVADAPEVLPPMLERTARLLPQDHGSNPESEATRVETNSTAGALGQRESSTGPIWQPIVVAAAVNAPAAVNPAVNPAGLGIIDRPLPPPPVRQDRPVAPPVVPPPHRSRRRPRRQAHTQIYTAEQILRHEGGEALVGLSQEIEQPSENLRWLCIVLGQFSDDFDNRLRGNLLLIQFMQQFAHAWVRNPEALAQVSAVVARSDVPASVSQDCLGRFLHDMRRLGMEPLFLQSLDQREQVTYLNAHYQRVVVNIHRLAFRKRLGPFLRLSFREWQNELRLFQASNMLGAPNLHPMDRQRSAPGALQNIEGVPQPVPRNRRTPLLPYTLTATAATFDSWLTELSDRRLPTPGRLALIWGDPNERFVQHQEPSASIHRRPISGVSWVVEHLSRAWWSEFPDRRFVVWLDAANPLSLLESYRRQINAIRSGTGLEPPIARDQPGEVDGRSLSRAADELLNLLDTELPYDMEYMVVWFDIQDEMPQSEQTPRVWAESWFFSQAEVWRNSRGRFVLTTTRFPLVFQYMLGYAQSRLGSMEFMGLSPQ